MFHGKTSWVKMVVGSEEFSEQIHGTVEDMYGGCHQPVTVTLGKGNPQLKLHLPLVNWGFTSQYIYCAAMPFDFLSD